MEGGTTFYFVTGGIEEALALAKKTAGSKDVKIGGGVSTVRQYLKAGLIDSLHLALTPVLLGEGRITVFGAGPACDGIFRERSQGVRTRNSFHT